MAHEPAATPAVDFETAPAKYRHWKLSFDGEVARLRMDVQEDRPLREGYRLKLNSYDLGVDIELADAIQRLRFEHPEVRVVVVESARDRIFCAGANINMLATSGHAFKVNFCKFTNETRLALEDASRHSGLKSVAALNGTCAGGGYELALACDEMVLVDDGNSAVSLPEVPLLAVLPGTGGLTRVVDKRKVRRDRADVFCTVAEGIKGKRAKEWGLVDDVVPKSRFDAAVAERAKALAAKAAKEKPARKGPGVPLAPLEPKASESGVKWRFVTLDLDRAARTATLTVSAPDADPPKDAAAMRAAGSGLWALRAFRELDDALLRLRVNHLEIGLVLLKTRGDGARVLASDAALAAAKGDWFADEVVAHMARVLRRLDLTAKSLFALVDAGSCFAGSLLEVALAADRAYMLDDGGGRVTVATSGMNAGPLPMSNGLTRLQSRFLGEPDRAAAALAAKAPLDAGAAEEAGLVTFALDAIDWDDEVRVACEERASLSPDSLTGMEANLRWGGPETMETKVFGRLTAWQNWIFQRPNAVGERGALTMYGKPERPKFDWNRT
ncbi:MAG TPA: 2,3-epoxybenzoyl-CoA dihydrolase [Planctomycetota bacterium]|nr:2,3-epoxybenzoyl-CoA dihydrolase [Planctomycetota bacterium]